jgi:hypothetical protein
MLDVQDFSEGRTILRLSCFFLRLNDVSNLATGFSTCSGIAACVLSTYQNGYCSRRIVSVLQAGNKHLKSINVLKQKVLD